MKKDIMISINNLSKVYPGNFQALKNVNLEIKKGEIFALLGPNGAGKTTLISAICGIANPSSGEALVNGYNVVSEYKKTRALIGLVPQELTIEMFETVWDTVSFSRGLFAKPKDDAHIEKVLKSLSLWDKRKNKLMTLSGGMKRRVLIAKALSHEPEVLFLDEPTAGVDVELRKEMWALVHDLRASGVTIILTTHYIEEAEEMADRVGVINQGEIILVEEKRKLMEKMGAKKLVLELTKPLKEIPIELKNYDLAVKDSQLVFTYDPKEEENGVKEFLDILSKESITYTDLDTKQSSLEEIFVELVRKS